MIPRVLSTQITELHRYYPIVSLSGPRQSGKTTLLRHQFPDLPYSSMEDPDQRRFALTDPRGFLDQYPDGCIIDEAQLTPELFSYLQTRVDTNPGLKYLISGSQNFLLMEKVTQSLAGRVGLLTLLPFSQHEIPHAVLDDWMWKGGYPALYDKKTPPGIFFPNYLRTYLERDVRSLLNVGSLLDFERFIRLCAGRTGQTLNLSNLASDSGISVNTAKAWLSVLEASFVVFLLPPYHNNFNKRIIKMPKLYFWDTGLVSWLLGISEPKQLSTHFAVGSIFENAVIAELAKRLYHQGEIPRMYFFRDSNGNEVDLLLEQGLDIFAFEMKYGKTVNDDYFKGLNYWSRLTGNPIERGRVIYGGHTASNRQYGQVVPWDKLDKVL
ncbi:MAG TPA: ATP-binding protein [Saprospiraceae bacterium]|nr:ATP-binding protein [Saprospiraceae bacterium]